MKHNKKAFQKMEGVSLEKMRYSKVTSYYKEI